MATATWIASRVDHGQIRRLADLWQLDIDSTSALCTAYNQSLRQLATSDEVYKLKVGEDLERQLPNVKFRVAANCELDAGLSAAEARVRKLLVIYPDGDGHERWIKLQADLGALHPDTPRREPKRSGGHVSEHALNLRWPN